MKIKLFSVLMMLCAYVNNASAHNIRHPLTSSKNESTDNVAGMATDAAGNTYVMQNLYYDHSSSPDPSVSISGHTGTSYTPSADHGCIIIDKVNAAGTVSHYAYISIANSSGSSVTGTSIKLSPAGKLYVAGYFEGTVTFLTPSGFSTTQSASGGGYDAFLCSFDMTSNRIDVFNRQGGTGSEYPTDITFNGTDVYISGHYRAENSTSESTVFNTNPSGSLVLVTATTHTSLGVSNSFILRFNTSALTCTAAYGWVTLDNSYSSFIPNGLLVLGSTANQTYITGSYVGNVTLSTGLTLTNPSSSYTRMFVWKRGTSPAAFQEGVILSGPHNYGRSSGNAIYSEGSHIMVAGTITQNPLTTGHYGDADAVLIRYAVNSSSITEQWRVYMGGNGNDVATCIVNNGGDYVVGGYSIGGNAKQFPHSIGNTSTDPIVNVGSSALPELGFVASYSATGTVKWVKSGYANNIKVTAVSSNQKCYTSFGGYLSTNTTWDEGTVMGTASPANNRLFFGRIASKDMVVTPTGTSTVTRPAIIPFSASGASSYLWNTSATAPTGIALSAPQNFPTCSLNVSSTATLGTYTVRVRGYYTVGDETCETIIIRTVNVIDTSGKTDGTEVATSIIDDANQPMLSFNTFPNPTTGSLTISYSLIENEPAMLQAVDMLGRVVYEKQVSAQYADETLDTDTWSNGMYVVTIQQNGKVLASKNVLKQ